MNAHGVSDDRPVTARLLVSGNASALTWSSALNQFGAAGTYWLSTSRASGQPHTMPVLAVYAAGGLYFAASPSSQKAHNLARDARCTLTTSSNRFDMVVEGSALPIRDDRHLQEVAEAYGSKYGWDVAVRDGAFHDAEGAPTAGPPPYDVYELTLVKAFAFATDDESAGVSTRWTFSRRQD